ncbi:MAG: hypothetical protein LC672_02710, partial [Acidobacteria bacterium]|nr:hypothetical protein [Acidobacteriota bacterium]
TSSTDEIVKEGSQGISTTGLASELRRLFWEYDFDALSWERDNHFITKRILTHGGLWSDSHGARYRRVASNK